MRRLALVTLTALVAMSLVACNTIAGAGKDVKAAGGAVEKAAKQ